MRNKIAVISIFLVLILSACGANQNDSSATNGQSESPIINEQNDTHNGTDENIESSEKYCISDILFKEDDISDVQILIESSSLGKAYVTTNEEERQALVETIYERNANDFESYDQFDFGGTVVDLLVKADNDEKSFSVISADDAIYLILGSGDERIYFKGPHEAFAFTKLNQFVADVLGNTEDPYYSGKVVFIETAQEQSVNKGNSAYAAFTLDNAIANAGTSDYSTNDVYDIEFVFEQIVFKINVTTGQFVKIENENMIYAQLEKSDLMQIKARLGVNGE